MPHSSAILISASAGSGKTYQLTQNYLKLAISENDISNILAITFTDNATKEMKEKILKALKQKALDKSDLDFEKARVILDTIFERYNQFNVRTIDSFVLSIFRAAASEMGLRQDFDVMFNYTFELRRFFLQFLLEKIYRNDLDDVNDFIELLNIIEPVFVFDPVEKIIELFEEFLKKEDDYLSLIKTLPPSVKKKKLASFSKMSNLILNKLKKISSYYKDALYGGISNSIQNADMESILKTAWKNQGIFKVRFRDKFDETSIMNDLRRYACMRAELFYLPYTYLYVRFREYFKKNLRDSNKVILSSIISELIRIMSKDSSFWIHQTCMKLSSFFHHFLIDEFQDTSYAQWSILRLFIEEALSGGGSCFLIGDVKQAIYMFRNADYRIMMDMSENPANTKYLNTSLLENGINVIRLDENWRSSPVILRYVDDLFNSQSFHNFLKDNGIDENVKIWKVNHIPKRDFKGYVKTKLVEDDEVESEVVNTVKELIGRFDFSDIVVLSYKNQTLDEISKWLDSAGIPVLPYSKLDIRNNSIIKAIISFLKFIDNPYDEISFSRFLLSEVFLKKVCKDITFVEEIMLNARNSSKSVIDVFSSEYNHFFHMFFKPFIKRNISTYQLLLDIYRTFDIFDTFKDESAYLIKLLDISLDAYFKQNIYSISDFLNYLSSKGDDEFFSVDISQAVGAVKLMTFHKAKGLEFPCVVNVFANFRPSSGPKVYYSIDNGSIKLWGINKDISKADERLLQIYTDSFLDERYLEINMVYVALTRAKYELYNIVSKHGNPKILSIFCDTEVGEKVFMNNRTSFSSFQINPIMTNKGNVEFILEDVDYSAKRILGVLFHRAFYIHIILGFDIDESIKKAFVLENIRFDDNIAHSIKKYLSFVLDNRRIKEIFSKKNINIKSEVEFYDENGDILRADLVVIDDFSVYVIDFKTGERKIDDEIQIKKYMASLSKMFSNKRCIGMIFYITEDNIVEFENV